MRVSVDIDDESLRAVEAEAFREYLRTGKHNMSNAVRALLRKSDRAEEGYPCKRCKRSHGAPYCQVLGRPIEGR